MAHLWVGGALGDPSHHPVSFLPLGHHSLGGVSFPGWIIQQEDGS